MTTTNNTKALEVGRNYREIFALPEGFAMIFEGNDTWTARKPSGESMTRTSAAQTAKALEYINRPSTMMGTPR